MKGIQGLILAIGLGIAGALFNFSYLSNKASEVELVPFVGLAKDMDRGEVLRSEHVQPVQVPKMAADRLKQYAVLYSAVSTVLGEPVSRSIPGGSLLLLEDTKTPAARLNFSPQTDSDVEERALGIPIDARTFVAPLVKPGDMVSFLVSNSRLGRPTPAHPPAAAAPAGKVPVTTVAETGKPADAPAGKPAAKPEVPLKPIADATAAAQPVDPNAVEIIGPFKVLSIGNRLGDPDIMRSHKITQVQENVILVSVRLEGGQLEAKAQKLWSMLQSTNMQQVGVLLHPPGK